MRVLAVFAAVMSCAALAHDPTDRLPTLLSALHVREESPVSRIAHCARALGPIKCMSTFTSWRAGKAIQAFTEHQKVQFNLTADVEQFPWERYVNVSDDDVYSQLCDRTESLLQQRSLKLSLLGYELHLHSTANGKIVVDVSRKQEAEVETSRGNLKIIKKRFYELLPFLVIPGLLMSAVLPFMLPPLKMMTMASVMINNMALTGAVFTMLRNNAFNDNYHKKIIYVNEGYHNEEHRPIHASSSHHYYEVLDGKGVPLPDEVEVVENFPQNWMNPYQGGGGGMSDTQQKAQNAIANINKFNAASFATLANAGASFPQVASPAGFAPMSNGVQNFGLHNQALQFLPTDINQQIRRSQVNDENNESNEKSKEEQEDKVNVE